MRPALLADIGGTNVRFALDDGVGPPAQLKRLVCRDYADPAAAVEAYLGMVAPADPPIEAAFAVASPVLGDRVEMTNHPWSFSIAGLRGRLGLARLEVINDFTALALAVPRLASDELWQVGGGTAVPGAPLAVLGPGTGLGVSGMIPRPGGWTALASEGGHVTLAPADERESEILRLLRTRMDHVSAERAISGPGLVSLYRAIATLDGKPAEALDPSQITDRALAQSDPLCGAALDALCGFLGTVAGNLALSLGARGGVYLGGGIVPRLGAAFAATPFRARFEAKGRFTAYMAAIPTHVITATEPAFIGLRAVLAEG